MSAHAQTVQRAEPSAAPVAVAPPRPGQPLRCTAQKYCYDLQKKDWTDCPVVIDIPCSEKSFDAGGMRICFDVYEVDSTGFETRCVAKYFRKDIPRITELDYFNEAMAQCLCEEFAQSFNKLPGVRKRISFLSCTVVRITGIVLNNETTQPIQHWRCYSNNSFFSFRVPNSDQLLFVMEPRMDGKFVKYNNNFGETYENDNAANAMRPAQRPQQDPYERKELFDAAEAFSHFTLSESGGSMLVCDLQGVQDLFTDPQIHTEDGKGLGMGNMGCEGIQKWCQKHQCNSACRAIQLRPLQDTPQLLPPNTTVRPPKPSVTRPSNQQPPNSGAQPAYQQIPNAPVPHPFPGQAAPMHQNNGPGPVAGIVLEAPPPRVSNPYQMLHEEMRASIHHASPGNIQAAPTSTTSSNGGRTSSAHVLQNLSEEEQYQMAIRASLETYRAETHR